MTLKEIQELIKLVSKTELKEFKYKNGDVALHIRGKGYQSARTIASAAAAPPIINVPAAAAAAPLTAAAPPPSAGTTPGEAPPPPPQAAAPAPGGGDNGGDTTAGLLEIKSPMIGTFYRSSSPDKPPYVKVGDTVSQGDTVCVVEAMKLFNEIESELSGKIVKVLVEDAQPIEYDQPLFLVEPA